jgi:hypothetical protein
MYAISRKDHRKFVKPSTITRWDRMTNNYLNLICPYDIGNAIRCIENGNICYKCLRFYVYCRNLTGIGRM